MNLSDAIEKALKEQFIAGQESMKDSYSHYTITVEKEEHYGEIFYVGRVAELPNISAFEETFEEARLLVIDAIKTMKKISNELRNDQHENILELKKQIEIMCNAANKYQSERDALQARIDGGIRVSAKTYGEESIFADSDSPFLIKNAALILDEGVHL